MTSLKYGKFEMPEKINIEEQPEKLNFAKFIAEPFGRGFAHTIGNSLRRILLSSLEAPAIVSIRIEGVHHEYMPVSGVVEDMTNIILNIKGALLRRLHMADDLYSHEPRILTSVLDITQDDIDSNKGKFNVTLGDIVKDSSYEVVNPDLHIFTATKPFRRQIDLRVSLGKGYVPSERHIIRDKTTDEILVDAAFSPVRLVNYFVENTRVGQDTDFDRLILEITTDGRLTPVEALSFAAQISTKHFEIFNKIKTYTLNFDEADGEGDSDADEMMEKLALRIDEIELSVRSTNCLSGANIETIAELVSIPERKMLEFRNFGKKSLNEIKAKLVEMNLHLGMDLTRYGITQDNVKDKVRHYQEEKKGRNKQKEKEEER
jgi:DNA-directed RNA polymerase subunit alpha